MPQFQNSILQEEQEVNTTGGANISDGAAFHSSLLDASGSAGTVLPEQVPFRVNTRAWKNSIEKSIEISIELLN